MIKSIVRLILFVLFATFLIPAASFCEDKKMSSKALLEDLQRGFWLNKAYIAKLQKTRSPRKAALEIYESGFWIKKEDNSYPVMVLFDFHDSGTTFTITDIKKSENKDVYKLTTTPEQYSNIKEQDVTLTKKKSGDEIKWNYTSKDNKRHDLSFIRVEPNLDQYINKLLVAGEYQDSNNRTFKFTEDGKAVWPDRSFKYDIDLDFALSNSSNIDAICDSIVFVDIQNRKVRSVTAWHFNIDNNRLLIYEPNKPCKGNKILHSLRRIK